jgi:hypothetical protein
MVHNTCHYPIASNIGKISVIVCFLPELGITVSNRYNELKFSIQLRTLLRGSLEPGDVCTESA